MHENDLGENYLQLGAQEHICKPLKRGLIKNSSSNSEIIQQQSPVKTDKIKALPKPINNLYKPEFKIDYIPSENNCLRKLVIVFDSTNKNLCYVYSYDNGIKKYSCNECKKLHKSITARLNHDEKGSEYLEVDDIEHVCNPVEYIPMEASPNVVRTPNYKFEYYTEDGMERKTLTVYAKEDKNLCYFYILNVRRYLFTCYGCNILGKTVTAKLHQDGSGEEYIKLSEIDHVCQPKPEDKVLDPSEFKLVMDEKQNASKITIFDDPIKSLGYEFIMHFFSNSSIIEK